MKMKKLAAVLSAAAVTLSAVSVNVFAAGETPSTVPVGYGNIEMKSVDAAEKIYGATISEDVLKAVAFSPKNDSIGRNADGYWCGFYLEANDASKSGTATYETKFTYVADTNADTIKGLSYSAGSSTDGQFWANFRYDYLTAGMESGAAGKAGKSILVYSVKLTSGSDVSYNYIAVDCGKLSDDFAFTNKCEVSGADHDSETPCNCCGNKKAAAAETTAADGTTAAETTAPGTDEGTKTVLSSTSTAFDNSWGSAIEIDASSLSSVKAGDKLTFTVSAVEATPGSEEKKIGIQDANWGEIGDGIYIDITDPATVEYTITAEALDKIKGGIKVKGVNITVSEVALITFGSSETVTTATTAAPVDPSTPNIRPVAPSTEAPATEAPAEVVTGANGESVEAPKDVVPAGATLEAKEQTKEEAVKAVEAITATDANKEVVETVKKAIEDAKATVMDINLVKDGKNVQPNGTLKVTINVPESLKDAANLFVYRVEDNGTFTDVKATVKDGKISFTTSHFSTYIITSEALSGDAVVTEAAVTTAPAATTAGDNSGDNGDKNQATGVILAVIPAMLAAAGVVISKKRK